MKKLFLAFVALLPLTAHAQLYPLFGPSAGIMKGSTSTPQTSSAAASDVTGLFSCGGSSSLFLRGDGTCVTPAGTGVSSVTVPAPLTATGCTGGACAITWTGAQTANQVLASPNGSSGAVSLRALVGADIPAINVAASGNGGVTGTLGVTNGGNGLNTATLGDLRYGSGTNTIATLAGNTTTTNKFLTQTGTGTVSAAPAWNTIASGDVPPINLGSTANGGVSSSSILLGTNCGTSNGFFSVTGPATSLKTFTFPNASATVLTTNAAVTVAQGGTGVGTLTTHGVLLGEGTGNISAVAAMAVDTLLQGQGSSSDPAAVSVNNCGSSNQALSYSTSTHTFGCQTISTGGASSANPSATIGLTAVNGTASTFMTSDSAPPLSQSIAPNMTSLWTFSHSGSTNNGAILVTAVQPDISLQVTGGGTDSKNWDITANGTDILFRTANDALSTVRIFMDVTRSANTISTIALGNITDTPAITGNGVSMTPTTTTSTGTTTGCTTAPTSTLQFTKIGGLVTVRMPGVTCTSNSTGFTLTGAIPAGYQTAGTAVVFVNVTDNGTGQCGTGTLTASSSTFTLSLCGTASFTASGTKGFANTQFSYTTN